MGGLQGYGKVPIILASIGGALIGFGLMIYDELVTFLRYNPPGLSYFLPFLGNWDPYDVEILSWILVFIGVFFLLESVNYYYRWLNRWLTAIESEIKWNSSYRSRSAGDVDPAPREPTRSDVADVKSA